MDLPFWSDDLLLFLDQEHTLLETTCHTTENPKFCLTEDAFPVADEEEVVAEEEAPIKGRLRQQTTVEPMATGHVEEEHLELTVCAAVLTACDPTRHMDHCIDNPDWIDYSLVVETKEEEAPVEEKLPTGRM